MVMSCRGGRGPGCLEREARVEGLPESARRGCDGPVWAGPCWMGIWAGVRPNRPREVEWRWGTCGCGGSNASAECADAASPRRFAELDAAAAAA
jgi:hypothetical protein